jgi:ureidoacrylate peracid hydrolase
MLTTLAEKVDPRNAALIVIDVQNDFAHEDSPFTKRYDDLSRVQGAAKRLDKMIAAAREAGTLVVFVQNVTRPGSRTDVQMEQAMRVGIADPSRSICQEGTWGSEFYVVSPKEGDLVVQKTRYSAFINTDLKKILDERGIKTLIMTGISSNTCVESTSRDGFMLDYYVVFVDDCAGDFTKEWHDGAVANIELRFGLVTTADEVERIWSEVAPTIAAAG